MTDLTREQLEALLDGATQGPWQADGEPWNRIVWSSAENRVCFMAHSNGLDDARDIATSNLVAAAPDLARQCLSLMDERDEAQAAQAGVCEKIAYEIAELEAHDAAENDWRDGERLAKRIAKSIHSLADPTGVKLLAEVRAERDNATRGRNEWRDDYKALAMAIVGETGLSAMTVAAQARLYRPRAEAAEAERDRLADALAVLEAKVAGLVEALNDISVFLDFRGFNEMEPTPAAKIARAALSATPTGEESNG